MFLADLTNHEVQLLTTILQVAPNEHPVKYSNKVLTLISELPSHLKRPRRLRKLVSPPQDSFTTLCPLHRPLDAWLVHAVFQLFSLEVGVRLNSMIANNHLLNADQLRYITAIRELHGLWLPKDVYEKTFLAPEPANWKLQKDGCEACMLARMAGDLDILLGLRLSMLSRTHKQDPNRHRPPAFLRWVEAWLAPLINRHLSIDVAEFERMMCDNGEKAEDLKQCRKQIWRSRRRGHRQNEIGHSETSASAPSARNEVSDTAAARAVPATLDTCHLRHDGPSDYAAVTSVIDHYAALMSSTHLPLHAESDFLHPDPFEAGTPIANAHPLSLQPRWQPSICPSRREGMVMSPIRQRYQPCDQSEAYANSHSHLLSYSLSSPAASRANPLERTDALPSPYVWTDANLAQDSGSVLTHT